MTTAVSTTRRTPERTLLRADEVAELLRAAPVRPAPPLGCTGSSSGRRDSCRGEHKPARPARRGPRERAFNPIGLLKWQHRGPTLSIGQEERWNRHDWATPG